MKNKNKPYITYEQERKNYMKIQHRKKPWAKEEKSTISNISKYSDNETQRHICTHEQTEIYCTSKL